MDQLLTINDFPRLQPGNYWYRGEDTFNCPSRNDEGEDNKLKMSDKELFDKILREFMTI